MAGCGLGIGTVIEPSVYYLDMRGTWGVESRCARCSRLVRLWGCVFHRGSLLDMDLFALEAILLCLCNSNEPEIIDIALFKILLHCSLPMACSAGSSEAIQIPSYGLGITAD